MAKPTEPKVKGALTDFHQRIQKVIDLGWTEWREIEDFRLSKGWEPILYPRTTANVVFDAIARSARKEFGSDSRCRLLIESQTIKVCFDNQVIGRFKKGDEDGLGRNVPTQAALDFTDPQLSLPGLPPEADKVEFTWSANDIGTKLDSTLVVARDGKNLLWAYQIPGDAEATIVEFPLDRPAPSSGTAGDDLVVPKKPSEEENEEPGAG